MKILYVLRNTCSTTKERNELMVRASNNRLKLSLPTQNNNNNNQSIDVLKRMSHRSCLSVPVRRTHLTKCEDNPYI